MATTTVRVDGKTHQRLRGLAKEMRRPMTEVVAAAVKELETKRFWDEVRESYRRLRADPEAWADYKRETEELEGVLLDGLENEPPYFDESNPR